MYQNIDKNTKKVNARKVEKYTKIVANIWKEIRTESGLQKEDVLRKNVLNILLNINMLVIKTAI